MNSKLYILCSTETNLDNTICGGGDDDELLNLICKNRIKRTKSEL